MEIFVDMNELRKRIQTIADKWFFHSPGNIGYPQVDDLVNKIMEELEKKELER